MTYQDQFVVEVKCKGKILRTINDIVYLPFGAEYSLYFKNLSNKRASISVSIDGQDVLDSHTLVLAGNESTELEGFLRGNQAKNRFKFIQKTPEIQKHRGDKIDDGFIRIEFAYEKPKEKFILNENEVHHHYHYHNDGNPFNWNYGNWYNGDSNVKYSSGDDFCGNVRGMSTNSMGPITAAYNSSNVTCDSLAVENVSLPLVDEGITVKGSEMHKDYRYTTLGELEDSKVIVIHLKGISKTAKPIQQPLTVSSRLTCSSCGRKSKSSFKYCPNCGTYLE